jgi:hypothetical protein
MSAMLPFTGVFIGHNHDGQVLLGSHAIYATDDVEATEAIRAEVLKRHNLSFVWLNVVRVPHDQIIPATDGTMYRVLMREDVATQEEIDAFHAEPFIAWDGMPEIVRKVNAARAILENGDGPVRDVHSMTLERDDQHYNLVIVSVSP